MVKPSVSAGSRDTARYAASEMAAARDHVQRLLEAGRTVLVQPYQDSVDIRGATALMFVNGRFSHAARKAALLAVGRPPTTEQVFVTGTTSRHHIGFSSYRRAAGGRRDRRRSRVVR